MLAIHGHLRIAEALQDQAGCGDDHVCLDKAPILELDTALLDFLDVARDHLGAISDGLVDIPVRCLTYALVPRVVGRLEVLLDLLCRQVLACPVVEHALGQGGVLLAQVVLGHIVAHMDCPSHLVRVLVG